MYFDARPLPPLSKNVTNKPNLHFNVRNAAHTAAGRWSLGVNAEEFIRGKFLFGLNESFCRFREDIFHRHGQRKPDDTPFTPAFVVNQVISFEAA